MSDDPITALARFFARECGRLREEHGLSQSGLASKIPWSASLIAQIETARRAPPIGFGEALDELYGYSGVLAGLAKQVRENKYPAWFAPYLDLESRATDIRTYEPLVISGLVQNPEYARAISLADRPDLLPEQLERDVQGICARQEILRSENRPHLWLIQDEASLVRPIGSVEIMREQLARLLAVADMPRVTLQVQPFHAGAHASLSGALTILELKDDARVAYAEAREMARVISTPEDVKTCDHAFDRLRATALHPEVSRELVTAISEELYE